MANINPNKIIYIHRYIAVFTGCFFLSACENNINDIKNFNARKTGVEEAKNVTIKYSVRGKRKAVLSGPVMYRVQDTVPYVEFPKTVHVDFFGINDSIESTLNARYAKYKETQSRVYLKDSVTVRNIKGDTLYCDELYWDRARTGTEFYTDKPVRIRTKTHVIDGIGMEAKQDFKEWHILQPKGFLKVASSEFPD